MNMPVWVLYAIAGVIILGGSIIAFIKRNELFKKQPKSADPNRQSISRDIEQSATSDTEEQKEGPEKVTLDGDINAVLVDSTKRAFRPVHIELKPGKNYGRQWEYLQYTSLYYLRRKPDGSIIPETPPEILEDSPAEVYEALQTADDMEEVFGWRDTESDKFKLWYWILAACVALFLMIVAMTYHGEQ